MIRDAEKLKKIKEYRQVTHKNEILALTEEKMESNDWKQIMEIEGWKKDYKYLKEDYIKEELAEEYKEVSKREKAITDLEIELEALRNWKRFFMLVMEQEGDIDVDESEYNSLVEEIDETHKLSSMFTS